MFAAQVGPEDAVSNISKWLRWANVPDVLKVQATDQWATGIGFLFLAISIGLFLLDHGTKNTASAFKMTVSEKEPYFTTEGSIYSIRRTFNLKLENTEQSKAVSNWSVQILSVTPPTDYHGPWPLKDGPSLAAGDHVFIPLVIYNEARSPSKYPCGDTFITMGTENGRPNLDIGKKYTLSLRATAQETSYSSFECKVWVDDNGRLRIAAAEMRKRTWVVAASVGLGVLLVIGILLLNPSSSVCTAQVEMINEGRIIAKNIYFPP